MGRSLWRLSEEGPGGSWAWGDLKAPAGKPLGSDTPTWAGGGGWFSGGALLSGESPGSGTSRCQSQRPRPEGVLRPRRGRRVRGPGGADARILSPSGARPVGPAGTAVGVAGITGALGGVRVRSRRVARVRVDGDRGLLFHGFAPGSRQIHPGDQEVEDHVVQRGIDEAHEQDPQDRKSTRLNSSHVAISYAVF